MGLLESLVNPAGVSHQKMPHISSLEMIHIPDSCREFVPFIIVTSFAVLNLFIGIIVDAMQTIQSTEANVEEVAANAEANSEIHKRLDALQEAGTIAGGGAETRRSTVTLAKRFTPFRVTLHPNQATRLLVNQAN